MIIDDVKINITAGKGGKGLVVFSKTKMTLGPTGGSGGNGGDIFLQGVSGKKLDEVYRYAWIKGLKTTYYLRSMAATQIEKSTLDAGKFGFTQKREVKEQEETKPEVVADSITNPSLTFESSLLQKEPKLCLVNDPDCEACQ